MHLIWGNDQLNWRRWERPEGLGGGSGARSSGIKLRSPEMGSADLKDGHSGTTSGLDLVEYFHL